MILAVTGHRIETLGDNSEIRLKLIQLAKEQLKHLKPELVYSGMATGWDLAIALACLKQNIPFIAAVPFSEQAQWYGNEDAITYKYLLQKAQEIIIDSEIINRESFLSRNRLMVDNSDCVLALWNGNFKGGTAYTVRYAKSSGRKIINVYNEFLEL